MTPRQRVEAALRGEPVDRVPLTMYKSMVPQCEVERRLRNADLCIDAIEKVMHELLDQAAPAMRLIVGITEDIPVDRWQDNMLAIAGVLTDADVTTGGPASVRSLRRR